MGLCEPDTRRMYTESALERLLRRDRVITIAGLATVCVLAWLYILAGAGVGMNAWEMTRLALFPHQQAADMTPDMPGMDMSTMAMATDPRIWDPAIWALIIAMWWIMMVAMMSPSAARTVLLYARVHRHALAQCQLHDKLAPTGVFVAGYLLVWLGFSFAAAALLWLLEREAIVSATMMSSQSRWFSGIVLIAAGLYQLSPLKNACLSHCRTPAAFLSRHWRPHMLGALRLAALHGAFCIGWRCCSWVAC
jgi:predicted metal-binding membrane protein